MSFEDKNINLTQKLDSLESRLEKKREQFIKNNYYTQFQNIKDYDFQPNYIKIESVGENTQPVYYTTHLNPTYSKTANLSIMSPSNEYFIRKIVKEEFSTLILPYQHDLFHNINTLENEIYDVKVASNLSKNNQIMEKANNENIKNIFEDIKLNDFVIKAEYDNKIAEFTHQISYLNTSINDLNIKIKDINNNNNNNTNNNNNNINNNNNNNDDNIRNLNDIISNNKIINNNLIEEDRMKIKNLESQISNLQKNFQDQIDNLGKEITKHIDDSKIVFINNEFNKVKDEFSQIKENVLKLNYQIKPLNQLPVSQLNNLNYDELKYFPNLKKDIEYLKNRINLNYNSNNNNINEPQLNAVPDIGLNNSIIDKIVKDTKELSDRLDKIEKKSLNNNEINEISSSNIINNQDVDKLNDKIYSLENKILDINTKINEIELNKQSDNIQSIINNNNKNDNLNSIDLTEIKNQLSKQENLINSLPKSNEYEELKNLINENSNKIENIKQGILFASKIDFDNLKLDYDNFKKQLLLRKNSLNNSLKGSLISNRSIKETNKSKGNIRSSRNSLRNNSVENKKNESDNKKNINLEEDDAYNVDNFEVEDIEDLLG